MLALEAKLLSKEFIVDRKKIKALDQISLQVEKGDIFGIIGQSGAGKSTLLKCLSTLDLDFSGAVTLFGTSLCSANKNEIRKIQKNLAMIFQQFLLLDSKDVFENISLPLAFAKIPKQEIQKKVNELLALTGLEKKKNCYPSKLSGGEKQRVAIARALATSPQILFCDEATSSLDPKTTAEILTLLKQLNETMGLTIILITHEMEVIRTICNKVAVIEQGSIIEQGSVLNVFSSPQKELTKSLVQNTSHALDLAALKAQSSESVFLKLFFEGESAQKPILSHLISELQVEVNILSGWIDKIQSTSIGTLTIALKGDPAQKEKAFDFLEQNQVRYEVII